MHPGEHEPVRQAGKIGFDNGQRAYRPDLPEEVAMRGLLSSMYWQRLARTQPLAYKVYAFGLGYGWAMARATHEATR